MAAAVRTDGGEVPPADAVDQEGEGEEAEAGKGRHGQRSGRWRPVRTFQGSMSRTGVGPK